MLGLSFFSDTEAEKILQNTNLSLNNFSEDSRAQKLKTISEISILKLINKTSKVMYSFEELSRNLSWNLNRNEYLYLMGCANKFIAKYRPILDNEFTTLTKLFNLKNKGSKKIRKFLIPTFTNTRGFNSRRLACGITSEITEENKKIEQNLAKFCHVTYIPTFFRSEFIKFIDNTFLYNGALSKINNEIYPGCRFCTYFKLLPTPKETLGHLTNCMYLQNMFSNLIGAAHFSSEINLKNLFIGLSDGTKNEKVIFNVFVVLFFNLCFRLKVLNGINLENLEKKNNY